MKKSVSRSSSSSSVNTSRRWITVLVAVLLFQFACIAFLGLWISSLGSIMKTNVDGLMAVSQTALSAAANNHVVVVPSEERVYLPELHITLPLTDTSASMVYSVRSATDKGTPTNDEADISTISLASFTTGQIQAIGCGSAVRIKFEAKSNPYNPHETNAASVHLADGRILQAYSYSHPDCDASFRMTHTDSVALAALFAQAKSY